MNHHRYFRANPDQWCKQMRRIMIQARQIRSLEDMVVGYIAAYGGQR